MKFKHILIPLIMLSVIFSSCEDDMPGLNPQPTSPVLEGYYFRLLGFGGDAVASRTNYPNSVQSYFDPGDRVGIFTIDASGTAVQSNLLYTVVGNAGEAQALEDTGTKALEGDGYKYLIYYPYSKTMTLSGLADLTHSVSARQDMSDEDGEGLTEFEKSDFLWDLTTVAVDASNVPLTGSDGNKYVNVVMDHVTATIIINVMSTFGEGSVVPKLLNMQRTVTSGIDLTAAPTVDALRTAVFDEDYKASKLTYNSAHRGEVAMQQIKYSASDKVTDDGRTFRAAVPPQIIESGQTIVTLGATEFKYTNPDDKPLALKPGKRYTFHVNDPTKPFIDIDDDDSWIFDVIDPVTGEKVGLLCREYIRFQPQSADSREHNIKVQDFMTGYPIDVTVNGQEYHTKTISSQVWVFYDLWKFVKNKDHELEDKLINPEPPYSRNQNELKTDDDPYLDSGIALRFINDAHCIFTKFYTEYSDDLIKAGYDPIDDNLTPGGGNYARNWPIGNTITDSYGGIFLANHGQMWVNNSAGYGESSGKQREFYMHGGKIYWGYFHWNDNDFKFNGVRLFVMPDNEDYVTTQEAIKYGHINIIRDTKTGKPIGTEVSYKPYLPSDRNVGVLVPKYINDSRNADEGVITYPLVKIGYNNIWSKKGLRTRYYNTGEPIQCYQHEDLKFAFPHIFEFEYNGDKYKYDANTHSCYKYDTWNDQWNGSYYFPWGYWATEQFPLQMFDIPGSYAYAWHEKFDVYKYLAEEAPESEPLINNPGRREKEITFTKLYNYSAILYERDKLAPLASMCDTRMSSYIPRIVRFYELINYAGFLPAIKIMTNHIMPRSRAGSESYTESQIIEGLRQQKFFTSGLNGQSTSDVYMANVLGLDLRAIGAFAPSGGEAMKPSGNDGTAGYGSYVSFWMDADPKHTPLADDPYLNRTDAVAQFQNKIFKAWHVQNFQNIRTDYLIYDYQIGSFTQSSMNPGGSTLRSRYYAPVRTVLKFNHQNGPNPHEKTNAAASVARGVANMVKGAAKSKAPSVQAVSRVSSSGDDVSVTLTPISIYNR